MYYAAHQFKHASLTCMYDWRRAWHPCIFNFEIGSSAWLHWPPGKRGLEHCQLVVGADFSTIASRMSKFLHFSKLSVSHGLDGSGIKGLYLLTDEIPMHRGSDSFINQNSVFCVEVAISHHTEVLVIIMCARQLDYLANRWLCAAVLSTLVIVLFMFIVSDTIDVLYILWLL